MGWSVRKGVWPSLYALSFLPLFPISFPSRSSSDSCPGGGTGSPQGSDQSIQISCQVLPRGRWGLDHGNHSASIFPAGQLVIKPNLVSFILSVYWIVASWRPWQDRPPFVMWVISSSHVCTFILCVGVYVHGCQQ